MTQSTPPASGSLLHRGSLSRRALLAHSAGAVAAGTFASVTASHARADYGDARTDLPKSKAKSCIVLFLLGAPAQHETWDTKPNAPVEVRGDLGPISSAVPGFQVGEVMPKTAALTKYITALRGASTGDDAHSTSGYAMTTGVPHSPKGVEGAKPGTPNDWPCFGGILRYLRPRQSGLPAAITLPENAANDGNKPWPGQDAGFLGRAHDPWLLEGDPNSAEFAVSGLALPKEIDRPRYDSRLSLLAQLEQSRNMTVRDELVGAYRASERQALSLAQSSAGRKAFNLSEEPEKLRDRYGRNTFGQSVLLARRLAEAGTAFIRVNWVRVPNTHNNGHWDTHSKNTEGLKQLMPIMDQAYSALIEDLIARGMLDSTLVVWTGEFGRTPKINPAGGRDHWGRCFSLALAGGGVRGGYIHGASDRTGSTPTEGLCSPADITATLFHALGHSTHETFTDLFGRPHPISRGQVIREVFA